MTNLTERGRVFYRPRGNHFIFSTSRTALEGASRASSIGNMRGGACAFVVALLLGSSLLLLMASDTVEADIFPKIVNGYVMDSLGNPVVGANVTVKIINGTTIRQTLYYDSTEDDGLYFVTFEGTYWDVGDTIEATATHAAKTAQNSTIANESAPQYLNVTLTLAETMTLQLSTGWNMVSVPFADSTYTARTLGLLFGDVVVRWNSGNQAYDTAYIVGISPEVFNFPMTMGLGYWVYAGSEETLELQGNLPVGTQSFGLTIPQGGGWAMVSIASLKTTWHASDIPAIYSGSMTTVSHYSPVTQTYSSYITGIPFTDYSLVPGGAYWVYCGNSGTLIYDP